MSDTRLHLKLSSSYKTFLCVSLSPIDRQTNPAHRRGLPQNTVLVQLKDQLISLYLTRYHAKKETEKVISDQTNAEDKNKTEHKMTT